MYVNICISNFLLNCYVLSDLEDPTKITRALDRNDGIRKGQRGLNFRWRTDGTGTQNPLGLTYKVADVVFVTSGWRSTLVNKYKKYTLSASVRWKNWICHSAKNRSNTLKAFEKLAWWRPFCQKFLKKKKKCKKYKEKDLKRIYFFFQTNDGSGPMVAANWDGILVIWWYFGFVND